MTRVEVIDFYFSWTDFSSNVESRRLYQWFSLFFVYAAVVVKLTISCLKSCLICRKCLMQKLRERKNATNLSSASKPFGLRFWNISSPKKWQLHLKHTCIKLFLKITSLIEVYGEATKNFILLHAACFRYAFNHWSSCTEVICDIRFDACGYVTVLPPCAFNEVWQIYSGIICWLKRNMRIQRFVFKSRDPLQYVVFRSVNCLGRMHSIILFEYLSQLSSNMFFWQQMVC